MLGVFCDICFLKKKISTGSRKTWPLPSQVLGLKVVPSPRFSFPLPCFMPHFSTKLKQSVGFQVGTKAGLGFLQIFTKDLVRTVFVT